LPSPLSPPFPYTTLFRSLFDILVSSSIFKIILCRIHRLPLIGQWHKDGLALGLFNQSSQQLVKFLFAQELLHLRKAKYLFSIGIDRKSTRLNSSHVSISY